MPEKLSCMWHMDTFLMLKRCFFVNFHQNPLNHQKSLVYLYVAHFDVKNAFFDLKRFFLSISAKMLQNTRKT